MDEKCRRTFDNGGGVWLGIISDSQNFSLERTVAKRNGRVERLLQSEFEREFDPPAQRGLRQTANLYTASSEQPTNVKLLAGGNYDGIGGVLWTNGGQIIYVSAQSGNRDIWARDADGDGNPQQLTFERAAGRFPVNFR
jgi:hypothetical protein